MKLREPTDVQRAALGAALLPAESAIPAFRRLQALTNSLDRTDAATFRMLPMVYRNLKDAGLHEGELGHLKSVYRQSWYRNRLTIAAGLQAIKVLREAGMEPLALKGLGLIATAYPEPALRPMLDVDLLVGPKDFDRAASALLGAGWKPTRGSVRDFFRRANVFHAMPLAGPDGVELDLHRAMLEERVHPDVDRVVRARSVPAQIGHQTVQTLSREDHLILACVHGARWDWVPAIRWVADVAWLLKEAGAIDWDYIVHEARRRQLGLVLCSSLELAAEYCPAIPDDVTDRLRGLPQPRLAKMDFHAQNASSEVWRGGRILTRYAHMTASRNMARQLIDLPTYLEWIWELDRPRDVPLDGARRVWARVRGGTGGGIRTHTPFGRRV